MDVFHVAGQRLSNILARQSIVPIKKKNPIMRTKPSTAKIFALIEPNIFCQNM